MTVTASSFREHFTAFASETDFPTPLVEYWLAIAVKLVNADRWGDLTDMGVELFAAHNLVLDRRANEEGAAGGSPGMSTGVASSKSVDKVSVSYDTSTGVEEGAGHWNLTIYGTRFVRFSRMMGAGPVQVGTGGGEVYGAYVGPLQSITPWNL